MSSTTNTPENPVVDQSTGQVQTPQPVDASGAPIPTPDVATTVTSHHLILSGIVTAFEAFGRTLERDFEELAAEVKALAEKIRAKL